MINPEELTPRQIADEAQVDTSTVHKWIKRGLLPARREGIIKPRLYVERREWERFKTEHGSKD